jgi:hypothetical protein
MRNLEILASNTKALDKKSPRDPAFETSSQLGNLEILAWNAIALDKKPRDPIY